MSHDASHAIAATGRQLAPVPMSSGTPHRRREGFSLLELLVVIAIVIVLAGLLLPVVKSVRQSSYVASCSQKLRAIAIAADAYSQDNEDLALPVTTPPSTFWFFALDPYLEQQTLTGQVRNTGADQTTIAMKWAFSCPAWPASYQVLCQRLGAAYYYNLGNAAPGYGWAQWAYLTSLGPNRGPGTFSSMYNSAWYRIPRSAIERKSERPMCSDAPQYWFSNPSNPNGSDVIDAQTRHPGGLLTTVFWDGHIERLSLTQRTAGMLLTQ